jgi:hypothetical protein
MKRVAPTFYLGTHMPHWLARPDAPRLFVSHRRLMKRRTLPQASAPWALDSGGFTELSMYGDWLTTPAVYVRAVQRYRDQIGRMEWAAPQDWMCEPWIVAKTGLSVAEHQRRTVDNYLTLRYLDPTLPFVAVLQGWTLTDYLNHVDAYTRVGINLSAHELVGIGSVCRRQSSAEIAGIISRLYGEGISLHGFGVKGDGIRRYGWALTSADSMAWSSAGRRVQPCPHRHVTSCANCWDFAMEWRERFALCSPRPIQGALL